MAPNLSSLSITFLVTALNEEDKIEATVKTICGAQLERFGDYEILLVNDGSTDSTGAIMDRLATEDLHVRAVHNPRNLGLGGAYCRGIQHARMKYVMWVSGDNAETADSLVNITGHIGEADIVIPVLLDQRERSWMRRCASRTFTMTVNALFGLEVGYYNGAVVHRTELVKSISIQTTSFAYQAEALIKLIRRGCSYVEIPYRSAVYDGVFSHAMKPKNLLGVVRALARLFIEERLVLRKP